MSAPLRRLSKDLIAALTPHFELQAERREWLRPLLLDRPGLAGDLDWNGASRAFTTRLVALCLSRSHGEQGPALLAELLATLGEEGIGLDPKRQAALEALREQLGALNPDDLPADPATRHRRRLVLAGVGVAALVAAVAVGIPYWRACHRPMDGVLRVAVASFGRGSEIEGSRPSLSAQRMARQVSEVLDVELGALLASTDDGSDGDAGGLATQNVSVRGPSLMCPVFGRDSDTRAASAERLAERIDADIVIYGTLVVTDTGDGITSSRLAPAFHVTDDPRRLRNAAEFAGSHALGAPIEDPDTITGGGALGEAIRVRTSLIATFVVALSYFADRQYALAEQLLHAAAETADWPEDEGKEVVYLFLGNVVLQDLNRDTRLMESAAWFDRALALDGEYARARLGRAEVLFQQARGQGACQMGSTDHEGLEAAVVAFGAAKTAAHQPPLSQIPVKADFGAGRARFCQASDGRLDSWDEVKPPFTTILATYDTADGLLKRQLEDWAAEAAGMLGLIARQEVPYAITAGDPEATAALRRTALAHFDRAIEIGDRHARDAVYHTQRAELQLNLCDLAAAESALRAAEQSEARARAADESVGDGFSTYRDMIAERITAGTLGEGCVPDP